MKTVLKPFYLAPLLLLILLAGTSGGSPLTPPPLSLECKTFRDGRLFIIIKMNQTRIRRLIIKTRVPEDVRFLSSKPDYKSFQKGVAKWFIEVKKRHIFKIEAHLSRQVSKNEIKAEAIFKLPGHGRMLRIPAK